MAAPSSAGPRSTPQSCVEHLCSKIGLSSDEFSASNKLTLQFDSIRVTFSSHDIHSISAVCYVGEVKGIENVKKLLELNFIPDVLRFAIEPNSSKAVAVHHWDTTKLSPEEFYNDAGKFVDRAEIGQKLLSSN